jgi:hypothetical protein
MTCSMYADTELLTLRTQWRPLPVQNPKTVGADAEALLEVHPSPDAYMYKGHALYHLRDFAAAVSIDLTVSSLAQTLGQTKTHAHTYTPLSSPLNTHGQAHAFQQGLRSSPRDKLMNQGFWDSLTMLRQEQQAGGGGPGAAAPAPGGQQQH